MMSKLFLFVMLLVSGWSDAADDAEKVVQITPSVPLIANSADWESLGSIPGLDGEVRAIAVYENKIYVGGTFVLPSDDGKKNVGFTHIAMWNGSTWRPILKGDSSRIMALAVDKTGTLYAGGGYTYIDGVRIGIVSKWDGKNWVALASEYSGEIHSMIFDASGNLYAAGNFYNDMQAGMIMRWEGETWDVLAGNIDRLGIAHDLAVDQLGRVYVGGTFEKISDVEAHNVAMWDGKTWHALGDGVGGVVSPEDEEMSGSATADSIAFDSKGTLYVAGTRGVEKWNGQQWEVLDIKTAAEVGELYIDKKDHIYVGLFSTCNVEGGPSTGTTEPIQFWNGFQWAPFPFHGSNSGNSGGCTNGGSVTALTGDAADNLYAGGAFTSQESGSVNIAKWDGKNWGSFGKIAGVNDTVHELESDTQGNVYARGSFTYTDNLQVAENQIVKWNGKNWSALKTMDKKIRSMAVDLHGTLYAATGKMTGEYNQNGISYISKWDGTNWIPVTTIDYLIRDFVVNKDGVMYACGITGDENDHYGVLDPQGVHKWDGKIWSELPENRPDHVCKLILINDHMLYLTTSESSWVWDGTVWSDPALALSYPRLASQDSAYDGQGHFYAVTRENDGQQNINAWDTVFHKWNRLGQTNGAYVNTMTATGGYLYAGGSFNSIDGQWSPYLARHKLESLPKIP